MKIILTVQSCGNVKFRFGLNTKDSAQYFVFKYLPVVIIIGERIFITKTTCGQHKLNSKDKSILFTKGFDLYSDELSSLIKEKKWDIYEKGLPTKLEFELYKQQNGIELRFKKLILQ